MNEDLEKARRVESLVLRWAEALLDDEVWPAADEDWRIVIAEDPAAHPSLPTLAVWAELVADPRVRIGEDGRRFRLAQARDRAEALALHGLRFDGVFGVGRHVLTADGRRIDVTPGRWWPPAATGAPPAAGPPPTAPPGS